MSGITKTISDIETPITKHTTERSQMQSQPDAMWPIKLYIQKGGDIAYLAHRSNVSVATIRRWMRDGVPDRVVRCSIVPIPTQVQQFRDLYEEAVTLLDRHFG